LKPSDRVRGLIASIGWPCRLHPDVTEADWATWLEHFETPVNLGRCPDCDGKLEHGKGAMWEEGGA
jgi:hypothetical protein